MKFSNNDKKLFSEAGICVEDKEYSAKEIEQLKVKVADYIMSQSSKDIAEVTKKFNNILY